MPEETKRPFTKSQYANLTEEEEEALQKVANYLNGKNIETSDDETLSDTFNILRPCDACVPDDEIGEDLLLDIRRKFACVYSSALELAEDALTERGFRGHDDFLLCLEIDASYEDTTHVAIVDVESARRPYCYFHDYGKAWYFHFATLKKIAEEVLKTRDAIVAAFLRLTQRTAGKEA